MDVEWCDSQALQGGWVSIRTSGRHHQMSERNQLRGKGIIESSEAEVARGDQRSGLDRAVPR